MSIFVCIPTRGESPDFGVVQAAQAACDHFGEGAHLGSTSNAHNVCASRNKGVAQMLSRGFSHILFIDNDVTVPLDTISRLMALDANVATGCVPTTINGSSPLKAFITVAQHVEEGTNRITWYSKWFDGVRSTEACGGACLLVKRDVFEAIGFPWFQWPERYEGEAYSYFSEDVDFCNRVMAAGLGPIMADGAVRCGHERRINVASVIKEERDTWGSHRDILKRIGELMNPEQVVEYGCGHYSTVQLLCIPTLRELISYESDKAWLEEVSTAHADIALDARYCELSRMPSKYHPDADLVFIDCGASFGNAGVDYSTRCQLLDLYRLTSAVVVIHDADNPQIRQAVADAAYRYKTVIAGQDDAPDTAILSNTFDVSCLHDAKEPEPCL